MIKMLYLYKMVHFRGFSAIPKIRLKNQLWLSDNSEVDHKYCTKISKDVSNPGNFTGEPPQMTAQPPPAVAKYISKSLNYFPLYLFLFIIFSVFNYLFSNYYYYYYFIFVDFLLWLICWLYIFVVDFYFVDFLWLSFSGKFCSSVCRQFF
jgi:hypothetical protein